MKLQHVIWIMLVMNHVAIQAQMILVSKGEGLVRFERGMTDQDASAGARNIAMADAIRKACGTLVLDGMAQYDKTSTEKGKTENEQSVNSYFQLISNGEWLETLDSCVEIFSRNGYRWFRYTITGKIRKNDRPAVRLLVEADSCPDSSCVSSIFWSGQQLFIRFIAPVNGFVTIYAIHGDRTYRLLPYLNDVKEGYAVYPVRGDEEYVFFSRRHDRNDRGYYADEILLEADTEMDNYRIIILFSDVEFEKPILLNETVYEESNYFSKKEFYAPRSCNTVDFLKWMHESFARIPTLQINPLDITVINNNAK